MAVTTPLCVICGADIPNHLMGNSWRREFRAIRRSNHPDSYGKLILTDVAVRNRNNNSTPSYDDVYPLLIAMPMHPYSAFPFHELCWKLLQKMLHPHPVPLERFYDICLSCPTDRKGWLDWGHDYGQLMDRLPVDRYPWEDVYVVGYVKRYLGDEDSPLAYFKSDPFHVPEIQQAIEESRERRDSRNFSSISPIFRGEPDCFAQLPQEILEYIRILLPSHSVTSLRMATRSFASLPLNQSFWASRFEPFNERGFIFEARDPEYSTPSEQRTRDWKALYLKTSSSVVSSKEMMNRKRIWDSMRDLVDLLLEKPLVDPHRVRSIQGVFPGDVSQEIAMWRSVGGDLDPREGPPAPSGMPCTSIWEQTVSFPTKLRRMAVSIRTFNGKQYVSGLRLVSEEHDQDLLIGYVLPGKEKYIDIQGPHDEGGQLNGFVVAVGPRGIQALRITTTAGHISKWAGCPDGLPQTVRLCMKNPVPTLRASFDGFKLVSLAVPPDCDPLFPDDPSGHHLPLRTTGLWYPSIPAAHLHLHGDSFAGRDVSLREYRPLVHVMFGGPRGRYLKNLCRISVTVSKAAIVGMDFYYTGDGVPFECLRACHSTASADDSVKTAFDIDRPGGERLTGFQVGGDFFLSAAGTGSYRYGAITSLKVTTNRNRSFVFQPSAVPILKLPCGPYVRQKPKKTGITPGTTITGIYLMHDPKFGMISMGPISEDLSLRTEDDYDVDVPLINGNGVDANSDADAIFDEIVSLIRSGS